MKRLICKASIDIPKFLSNWYSKCSTMDENIIDNMISENEDCKYNGNAYRTMVFDISQKEEILKNIYEYNGLFIIDHENVINYLNSLITETKRKYYSFSKSSNGILQYIKLAKDFSKRDSLWVCYTGNISNGLDLNKLSEKYSNNTAGPVASEVEEVIGDLRLQDMQIFGLTNKNADSIIENFTFIIKPSENVGDPAEIYIGDNTNPVYYVGYIYIDIDYLKYTMGN